MLTKKEEKKKREPYFFSLLFLILVCLGVVGAQCAYALPRGPTICTLRTHFPVSVRKRKIYAAALSVESQPLHTLLYATLALQYELWKLESAAVKLPPETIEIAKSNAMIVYCILVHSLVQLFILGVKHIL